MYRVNEKGQIDSKQMFNFNEGFTVAANYQSIFLVGGFDTTTHKNIQVLRDMKEIQIWLNDDYEPV